MWILVIPDIHLKPNIFVRANELLRRGVGDRAVCLMDVPDDWNKQDQLDEYQKTYEAMIKFVKQNPETLWCWGNHDLAYKWEKNETGYSVMARHIIQQKQSEMEAILGADNPCRYVQRIDNVVFSHAGISRYFIEEFITQGKEYDDIDYVINKINELTSNELWNDASPIWIRRPQRCIEMYKGEKILQVVGHTPVKKIERRGGLIYCDTFSTYDDGTPIGDKTFLLLETLTWKYIPIK